jgi:hypothetical protein
VTKLEQLASAVQGVAVQLPPPATHAATVTQVPHPAPLQILPASAPPVQVPLKTVVALPEDWPQKPQKVWLMERKSVAVLLCVPVVRSRVSSLVPT